MSDRETRELARKAGDGDFEAAEELVATLARMQGRKRGRAASRPDVIRASGRCELPEPHEGEDLVVFVREAATISPPNGSKLLFATQYASFVRTTGPCVARFVGVVDQDEHGNAERTWVATSFTGSWNLDS